MTSLIRVEWLKMKKYNAFWWLIGLTALAYPGINYIAFMIYSEATNQPTEASQLAKMAIGNPYSFPDVWHTVAYFSSFFLFIPAIVVIMFITNEYSFKTHRQNIIDGWGRGQFITSKLIDVLIITLLIAVLYMAVTLVAGFANHTRLIRDTWGSVHFAGLFALQTFSQLSLAFLTGFLVRKAFIALGIFVIYFFPIEPLLEGLLTHYNIKAAAFLPLEVSDRMIPVPPFIGKIKGPEKYQETMDAIPQHVIFTVILTFLVWALCYWLNSKRDLK